MFNRKCKINACMEKAPDLCYPFLLHGPGLFNGQPLHEPAVLLWCEFPDLIRAPRPLQLSFFKAFVEEKETVALPEQGFEPVPATAAKQEKRRLERIHLKLLGDDGTEPVNGLAHVRIATGDEDMFC